ncbi:zona pellucida sperm-binding protein 4-like, partial [Polypterus senegalus]|uniref:zona pellucida sperm-binding protein 4-like n=1 Tax=Polypterus senegalus TaxID=55291 RepID=UPI001963AEEA
MARLGCWCFFRLAVWVLGAHFVCAAFGAVTKKCDEDKAMTLSFDGTPAVFLQKTRGGLVKVTKDLPGVVLHLISGRITLTVPFSSSYAHVSEQGSQYVVTIAVGSRTNVKTFTCPKPARRSGSVAERCTVADSEKLPCGGSSSSLKQTCTLDGQFVVVVSEKVTLPSLDLGSIQLVDSSSPNCSPVTSLSSFVLYQFPVSACGSTVQLSGGNVTYQNTMSAAITVRSGPEGSITRDSVY